MNTKTVPDHSQRCPDTPSSDAEAPPACDHCDELRALRDELQQIRELVGEACGAYLNARYPYGRPTDRYTRNNRYAW